MKIDRLIHFPYQVILGSASPRRQQLLKEMGFRFSIQPIDADESEWPADLKGGRIAEHLAVKKARAFPRELEKDELLITSDTIVWRDGQIYNKPKDAAEGKKMLRSLSGGAHEVFTAVCLRSAKKERVFSCATTVHFRELGDDEIDYYVTNFNPLDKAGSYGVQDWLGYTAIEKIEGSFYNVMGLPVHKLYDELLAFD